MIEERRSVIRSSGVEETVSWGKVLGSRLMGGDIIGLIGDLGAGKTYLVKGVAEGLGVLEDQYVASPTFTLINEYKGEVTLYHVDLYRIQDEREIEGLGYEEYLYGNGVVIIEWAEKMLRFLPEELLLIEMERVDENTRKITLIGRGNRFAKLVEEIEEYQKYQFNFSKFVGEEVKSQCH
jgi:tRNA threonylcarbamoyladenosine biosynthesis protein TsaE